MFSGRQTEYDSTVILNSGFWSDIQIEEFQKQRAIPLQIPIEMLKSVLIAAMQGLELDLAEVANRYLAQGIAKVDQIAGNKINGENFAQTLYKKAVFARAKAELLPEFNSLAAREIHEARNFVNEQKSLFAEATQAIRTLKGKTRGTVWLL